MALGVPSCSINKSMERRPLNKSSTCKCYFSHSYMAFVFDDDCKPIKIIPLIASILILGSFM